MCNAQPGLIVGGSGYQRGNLQYWLFVLYVDIKPCLQLKPGLSFDDLCNISMWNRCQKCEASFTVFRLQCCDGCSEEFYAALL